MARLAPDNSATRAVNRTAALRVLAAWDVAGDASEHAGSRWGAGERFARGKPKPLGTGLSVPNQKRPLGEGHEKPCGALRAPGATPDTA